MTKLFVISGPSGVGKDTILAELLPRNPELKLSTSCTTRSMREGETDGKDYFFISTEDFEKSLQNNEFLEWAEFSGNFYGTKRTFVEECLARGEDLILEIEIQGALLVKEKFKDAVMIFIAPPSVKELEQRLRGRRTDSEEAIQKRLARAKIELANVDKFDYVIINDTVENAVKAIEKVITAELT